MFRKSISIIFVLSRLVLVTSAISPDCEECDTCGSYNLLKLLSPISPSSYFLEIAATHVDSLLIKVVIPG